MINIQRIDNYVISISHSKRGLKSAKEDYKELKKELIENGKYIDRPNCTYTLSELNYAIKLINLKLSIFE